MNLKFSAPDVKQIAAECDAAFLALPHGLASEYAIPLMESGVRVFDISADFRLRSTAKYKEYYGKDHPAPELLKQAVYGSPERYREQIRNAAFIACPGCYPDQHHPRGRPSAQSRTGGDEGHHHRLHERRHGAGRKVDLPYIYPECNESIRAYGPVGHRHLPEIEQELAVAAGVPELAVNFIPHLTPMNRGINSTIVLQPTAKCTKEAVEECYRATYGNERFVKVLPAGNCPIRNMSR